ncbi:MAG: Flp family type IVb pilin [Planctomycetota bacterium]|jgi:Flp pilus assembly pilin Flp
MSRIARVLRKFVAGEKGLETVEYAIISGLIVAGSIVAITAIGVWVASQFGFLQTTLGA